MIEDAAKGRRMVRDERDDQVIGEGGKMMSDER